MIRCDLVVKGSKVCGSSYSERQLVFDGPSKLSASREATTRLDEGAAGPRSRRSGQTGRHVRLKRRPSLVSRRGAVVCGARGLAGLAAAERRETVKRVASTLVIGARVGGKALGSRRG